MERVEQLYRNNYSTYNYMFYNVYYGVIGKQCFTPRWRCVSYMEFAPLAPPLYFGIQPTPRSCQRSSILRSESGKRTYSITAKRMISGLVLKHLNGERFVIRRSYETTLPVSTSFCLTGPSLMPRPQRSVTRACFLMERTFVQSAANAGSESIL